MEEIINDDQVDDDNDAAIAGALAANAVTPMQSSRHREGDRHQTPQQRTTTNGGTGRGRSGGAGRGRGAGTGRGRGGGTGRGRGGRG